MEVFMALIVDSGRKKDRRRTCGHRHMTREGAMKCALAYTTKRPWAQSYVGTTEQARDFLLDTK